MSRTAEIIKETEKYSAHNYLPLPVVLSKGEGVWVWDVEGNRYFDMLSSYSAVNQGHRHPALLKAVREQIDRITLTSRAFHNDKMGEFLKYLCQIAKLDKALPMNTGAEAVETAIKAARKWGYLKKKVKKDKAEIIVCENNFHGRTTTIVGFSSEFQYRDGFGPFTPGFVQIPYNDPSALKRAITKNTVGFLVEPVQAEGGVIVPKGGYLKETYEICKKNNVLFIADEIQTGFGRTGKLFCVNWEGVKPDILIVGKSLGGGLYPVSAILSRDDIMDVFQPGDHGSTFAGNPLAAAIGLAALRVTIEENLAKNSKEMGDYFMGELKNIESPHIKEVRGKGLLIGVEIKSSSETARPFCEHLKEEGILLKETHEQIVRFAPPLTVTRGEIDWALPRIKKVLCE